MKHELPPEVLANNYTLSIKSVERRHKVMEVVTGEGSFCLKEYAFGWERLNFLNAALDHLRQNGFTQTPAIVPSREGQPGIIHDNHVYFLTGWLQGHDCNYHVAEEQIAAARCFAGFHLAGAGFQGPSDGVNEPIWGHIPSRFQKSYDKLKEISKMVRKKSSRRLDRFGKSLRECAGDYLQQWEKALKILDSANFASLLQQARENYTLCHGDPAAHNFMFLEDGSAAIIDMDHLKGDIWAHDLANFIYKPFKNIDWDVKVACRGMEAYAEVRPLSENEKRFVLAIMVCPYKIGEMAEEYYAKKLLPKEKDTLAKNLERWINREPARTEFLRLFEEYIG